MLVFITTIHTVPGPKTLDKYLLIKENEERTRDDDNDDLQGYTYDRLTKIGVIGDTILLN